MAAVLLLASLVLVLGALAVVALNLGSSADLRFGFEQMIHARVPWLLLGALGLGSALGVASVVRKRAWYKYPVVGVEVLLSGLLAVYFLRVSWLPPHALAVESGDEFPAYSLVDQDGQLHAVDAGQPQGPALYIFYRGDW